MVDHYRELVAVLRRHGCFMVRPGKGSHEIWFSPVSGRHVTVPRHARSRHTMNEILKQARLPKAF
jgi:predicted RNA binding protein YcfA (HicA-like mRNA interferase family)